MWIKCIHSQTVRLFNQNQPGEEIFRGCMMSDQDLEWQWWVLLLPKQSVTKRWYLSTASTETGCLKGKFVYSTVVATLLLNMLLLPGAICSVMSRTALKYLNVWVTVLGEKEHPAWPYCPSFPLHLAKSQHQTGMRTTAATFSEMMCYDNFFFFHSPSKFQMSDVANGWRCRTGAGTITWKELHTDPRCWETNDMWRCNLCSRMTYGYHTQSQGNLCSLLQLKQKIFRNTVVL